MSNACLHALQLVHSQSQQCCAAAPQAHSVLFVPLCCRSLLRLDVSGHVMSILGICMNMYLMLARSANSNDQVPYVALPCIMAVSVLQLCLMYMRPSIYKRLRLQLAWGNRMLRLTPLVGLFKHRNWTYAQRMLPLHHCDDPFAVLLGSICIVPLMLFYSNLCFVVPFATLIVPQLPVAVLSSILAIKSQQLLMNMPGMQALADSACAHTRGVIALVLHVLVDQGTMPGVPAAGFEAFGIPSGCSGHASFLQLALYANLSLTYFLPVYFMFCVELQLKRQFWQAQNIPVEFQTSLMLPFPRHHFASHCCVLLLSQLLLWFVAELLTVLLV